MATENITSVDVKLKSYLDGGDPDVDVTLSLYATDVSHHPTGVALGSAVVALSTISTAAIEWVSFALTATITTGIEYCLVLKAPSAITGDEVTWYYASTSYVFTPLTSTDGGTSWSSGGGYMLVKVYVNGIVNYSSATAVGGGYGIYDTRQKAAYWTASGAPPAKATTPAPTDANTGDKLSLAQLSWVNGGGATSYNVYFGPIGSMTLRSSGQAGVTFDLSSITPFVYLTEYQWRIDSINATGTTTGDTWTFTTLRFAPPLPTGVTIGDDGNPTGTPTGENAMIQVKRLVVAANNKIWYEDV